MNKKVFKIKTPELDLIPMDEEAIDLFEKNNSTDIGELFIQNNLEAAKEAYKNKSQDFLWYTCWKIVRKEKNSSPLEIGFLFFHGPESLGSVEISIYIDKEHRNQRYATMALKTINDWAFAHKSIYEITAHMDKDNIPAIKSLTVAGYVYRSKEHGIEFYSIQKQLSSWLGLYMMIGVWGGLLIGVTFGNMPIGFAAGLLIGFVLGKSIEIKERNLRIQITGQSK